MKNIIKHIVFLTCPLLFCGHTLFSQQIANPANNKPVTISPGVLPSVLYPGLQNITGITKFNFVRMQMPDKPVQTWPAGNFHFRQTTNYVDGLGKPLQTVAKKAHADGYDIIQHHVYDALGRETYQYLPFTVPVILSDGKIELSAETRLRNFYDQAGPDEQPYSKTTFDDSPLNKVMSQFASGRAWVGNSRAVQYSHLANSSTEDVRIWTIGNGAADRPVSTAAYGNSELFVSKTMDEDGKQTWEYKDKQGQIILRKPVESDGHSNAHSGYACTYYVYDDMQRLRYVIPPVAVTQRTVTGNTWTLEQAVGEGLCYSYFYDERGRLAEKRIPGKQPEYFVYDMRDRQVFSQDGNLRTQGSGKWMFTTYDALDRPTMSGIFNSSATRSQLATDMSDGITSYPANNLYYYLKNYGLFQSYTSSLQNCDLLSYNYYDNYDNLSGFTFDATQFNNISLPTNETIIQSVMSAQTKGLITGSKVRVMDPDAPTASNWLTTVSYYDDKGRTIQTQAKNHKNGTDISSNIYYFQGMLWKNILSHHNASALGQPGATDGAMTNPVIVKTFNRNIEVGGGNDLPYLVTQSINGGIDYPFAYYGYDHLDRIVLKQFPVGVVQQKYNIRGLLEEIKFESLNTNNQYTNILFQENLAYDKGFESKLYNGNIAGITWNGADGEKRAYGYSYDKLNRLSHAEYREFTSSTWNNSSRDYTASNITYDLNGNIQSMNQRAPKSLSPPQDMDLLTYQYFQNSNQLKKVTDVGQEISGLPDFRDNANLDVEYGYDQNGNMTIDKNKGSLAVTYTYKNKPERITVPGQGTITFTYDAAGNRLSKKVINTINSTTDVFDYIGDFVYKNNLLQYIGNEEGRARPLVDANLTMNLTKFVYDYSIKDHLGNVRSTVTATPMGLSYIASHEIAAANVEQLVFDNIPSVRDLNPSGGTGMSAHLIAEDPTKRIGTAIMLKTMPGDRFEVNASSYYEGENMPEESVSGEDVVGSLLGALSGGITLGGTPVSELPDNLQTVQNVLGNVDLPDQISALPVTNESDLAPKAYLNILFFDDKLQLIPGSSKKIQVGINSGNWTSVQQGTNLPPHVICNNCPSGFMIVYVDNQSIGKDVWFDDLFIGHYTSDVLEENHYYPFGLTLELGVNPSVKKNEYKFQNQRHDNDLNINMYSFRFRDHDPQIGRFWQVDPLAESYVHNSPYAFSENKVTSHIELEGLESVDIKYTMGNAWRELKANFQGIANAIDKIQISNESAVEVSKGATTVSTSKTVNYNTNFGEGLNYIMQYNTNAGLDVPLFTKTTETEKTVSVSKEVKIPGIAEASFSTSINDENVKTVSGEMSGKTPSGLNIGGSVSASSDKSAELEVNVSAKAGGTTVKTSAAVSTSNGQPTGFVMGMGIEQEVGNVKYSNSVSVGIGD